jgi:hypothetical protein
MNTIALLPEIVMSALQNMNTKRDTHEKRVIGKKQFQEKTQKPTDVNTTSSTANNETTQFPPSSVITEYTPSTEDQYLPKSLRGNNTNPYSIMNAMTETVQNASVVAPAISSNGPNVSDTNNTNVDLAIVNASIPVSEYTSTQKEVTITSAPPLE